MPMQAESFSGYTKGLHAVKEITETDDSALFKLLIPQGLHEKLLKRFGKFSSKLVSIDGVRAEVIIDNKATSPATFEVVAKVAKDLFGASSLAKKPGEVSLGMMSENPEKYLVEGSPTGVVHLVSSKIAPGHEHTKELTFECSKAIFDQIKELQYIGLNGSALFVRDPTKSEDERYFFSIHVGKNTQEKTVFGQKLPEKTACTLTLPIK